jgi:hypothetical protein
MFTRLFLITILVVLSTAPVFGGPIYVSSGNQILSVDSVSGAATTLYSADGFNPRGLTVGPDGNLYIAESGGAIYRFDPTQAVGTGNPTIIATVTGNPEALAFAANFDLYVSTSGSTGHVFRLHFLPVIPMPPGSGSNPPNPTLGIPTVAEAFAFGSGAGIAFGKNGNLLVAKKTSSGGISFAVATNNYSSASSLVSISNPIGMGVNTCGEILVAVGKDIQRRDKQTGDLLGNYVTFGGGDTVQYIGVTSTNNVFAVVTKNNGDGKVYRVAGAASAGTDILSCTSGTASELASLDDLVGLAVPASSAFITKTFGGKGPDNTCGTPDDVLTPSGQDFDFGHYTFTLGFKQLIHCFDVTVTAAMSRPQRITFSPGAFPIGTEATKFSSKGSFAVEFLAATSASSGIDYANPPDGVQTSAFFFTLLNLEVPPRNPGMAKSDNFETLIEREYDQDITQYFFPMINPDLDPGESGTDDDISRFVVFNGPLATPLCQFNLGQPARSNNPPWTQGSNLRVQFSCSNGNFPDLVAYLTIVKLNGDGSQTPQNVVSKTGQIDNTFSTGSGGNFTYNVDTSFLEVGTHQLIITSNRFAPIDGNPVTTDPPIIVTVQQ